MCTFWKGNIEFDMPQETFARHEFIRGRVILSLKKPIKARGFYINLVGMELVRDGEDETWNTFFHNTIHHSGDGLFSSGEYEFEIEVPNEAMHGMSLRPRKPEGALKEILIATAPRRQIEWHIIARLDIPMGLDISEKKRIYFKRTGDETGDYVEPGFKDHHQKRTAISQRRSQIAKGMKDTPGDEVYGEEVRFCPQCETPYHPEKGQRQCNIYGSYLPKNEK